VIVAYSPPSPASSTPVEITVTNDGGTSAANPPADQYTVDAAAPPTATVVSPDSGAVGTPVFITGTNLGATTEVDFGTDLATSFFVRSDTLVIAAIPCDDGMVDVTVKTTAGTATAPNKFKFQRCHSPEPPATSKPPRTGNPPPPPPGPPPGPRGLEPQTLPSAPLGVTGAMRVDGAGALEARFAAASLPAVTRSIRALLVRLRTMAVLLGGS